jgi:hypothetical protein
MDERKTNLIHLLYIFIVAVGDSARCAVGAASTAHRAEYLCYWFSFLTRLTMGEHARNM